MSDAAISLALFAYIAFAAVALARVEIVFGHRIRAIDADFSAFLTGPTSGEMMFDLSKWTFKQFYPSIGKAAK